MWNAPHCSAAIPSRASASRQSIRNASSAPYARPFPRPSCVMSRETVAWTASMPSPRSASHTSACVASSRSRTSRRMAPWRSNFDITHSMHAMCISCCADERPSSLRSMRRLLLLVGALVFVDTMFFAALTPLLPHYADRFDLSKAGAGVLQAAYPAGVLVGSLPSGIAAARLGVKATVLMGLGLLAATTVAFGL